MSFFVYKLPVTKRKTTSKGQWSVFFQQVEKEPPEGFFYEISKTLFYAHQQMAASRYLFQVKLLIMLLYHKFSL